MQRKLFSGFIVVLMIFLVGCSSVTPEKVMLDAVSKSDDVKSYGFNADLTFGLKPKSDDGDLNFVQGLSFLENVKITVKGVHDKDQDRAEMLLTLGITGDTEFSLNIPVVLQADDVYVKIPNIPFYPLPENVQGKFVKLNSEELEDQGITDETVDVETIEKLAKEFVGVLIEDFGDTDHVTLLKGDNIPSNFTDSKHVVQIKVSDETLEEFVSIFYDSTFPKFLDLMSKPEYLKAFNVDATEVEEVKAEFESMSKKDILDDIRGSIDLEEASYTFGVDNKKYLNNQLLKFLGTIHNNESFDIDMYLTMDVSYFDINKKQSFEFGVPASDQLVSLEELLSALFIDMSGDSDDADFGSLDGGF